MNEPPDEYRVRVYYGATARTLRHPRPRWGWIVQVDHVSRWAEHGDSAQLDGTDRCDTQRQAVECGVKWAMEIHAQGCDECTYLGIKNTGPLVVYVGPDTVIDERTDPQEGV